MTTHGAPAESAGTVEGKEPASPCSRLPDLERLTAGLSSALGSLGDAGGVVVLQRQSNTYASTFPSEIVTCRFADGRECRLLCKYEAAEDHRDRGHRGNVGYEADVYHRVLRSLPVSTPHFYGTCVSAVSGETWLVLQFIEQSVRLEEARCPGDAMRLAARWVGQFHRASEARFAAALPAFLTVYDREYYLQWVRRTADLAGHWHGRLPWLAPLCDRLEQRVDLLLAPATTLIHGEYVPHNLLSRGEEIYPIDWESAAIGMGEIDLASLTDKWPRELARACEQEYQQARWPEGAPPEFARTLDLARLYWDFRWLGDRPEWTISEKVGPRFEHLRLTAERLGLI